MEVVHTLESEESDNTEALEVQRFAPEREYAISEADVAETRRALRAHLDREELSIRGAARAMGYGPSTVSQFLSGDYAGDNEAVARAALDLLRRERERARRAASLEAAGPAAQGDAAAVVETTAQKRFVGAVRLVELEKIIGVVIGPSGVGKTVAARAWAEAHPASLYLEVGPEYTTGFLARRLCRAVGLAPGPKAGTIPAMMHQLYGRLKGSGRLVIVDQAETLPVRGLELLRRLHDVAGVPVVMVGMPRLLENLRGSRGELAQLFGRVRLMIKLAAFEEADTRLLLQARHPGYDAAFARRLHALSKGNARLADALIARARYLAQLGGSNGSGSNGSGSNGSGLPTPDTLDEAAGLLIL